MYYFRHISADPTKPSGNEPSNRWATHRPSKKSIVVDPTCVMLRICSLLTLTIILLICLFGETHRFANASNSSLMSLLTSEVVARISLENSDKSQSPQISDINPESVSSFRYQDIKPTTMHRNKNGHITPLLLRVAPFPPYIKECNDRFDGSQKVNSFRGSITGHELFGQLLSLPDHQFTTLCREAVCTTNVRTNIIASRDLTRGP